MDQNVEPYMTTKEAAEYLKIAEKTVVRLAHEGKLPGVKVGGQWRFKPSELDEFLAQATAKVARRPMPQRVADVPLEEIFSVEQIIPELKATNRQEVISEIVDHVTRLGLVSDRTWLEAALAAREKMVSTAVPEGVAFLHARRRAPDKFPKQFIAMARSRNGVVFGSPDMGKTKLFFLLALRQDALHLKWLSRLAWIVRNPARLTRLLEAETAEEMHQQLLEAAGSLPAALRPTGK